MNEDQCLDTVLHVEAKNFEGEWEDLGCCKMVRTSPRAAIRNYNRYACRQGLAYSTDIVNDISSKCANDPSLEPPLPVSDRAEADFDWNTIETCKTFGDTAGGAGITERTSTDAFDAQYNDQF